MIRRRAWGLAIFLGGWTGIFLGSFLFGAGVIMSRYTALAALPLLLAAAWLLATFAQYLRERLSPIPAASLATALSALAIAWPAAATGSTVLSWQAPVYTAFDAEQYVTEFGGGHVTEGNARLAPRPGRSPADHRHHRLVGRQPQRRHVALSLGQSQHSALLG